MDDRNSLFEKIINASNMQINQTNENVNINTPTQLSEKENHIGLTPRIKSEEDISPEGTKEKIHPEEIKIRKETNIRRERNTRNKYVCWNKFDGGSDRATPMKRLTDFLFKNSGEMMNLYLGYDKENNLIHANKISVVEACIQHFKEMGVKISSRPILSKLSGVLEMIHKDASSDGNGYLGKRGKSGNEEFRDKMKEFCPRFFDQNELKAYGGATKSWTINDTESIDDEVEDSSELRSDTKAPPVDSSESIEHINTVVVRSGESRDDMAISASRAKDSIDDIKALVVNSSEWLDGKKAMIVHNSKFANDINLEESNIGDDGGYDTAASSHYYTTDEDRDEDSFKEQPSVTNSSLTMNRKRKISGVDDDSQEDVKRDQKITAVMSETVMKIEETDREYDFRKRSELFRVQVDAFMSSIDPRSFPDHFRIAKIKKIHDMCFNEES